MADKNNDNFKPKKRTMGPGGNSGLFAEKANDFRGSMRKLLSDLSPYKYSLIISLILAILSMAFSVIGPRIMGIATTEIYKGSLSKLSGGSGLDFIRIRNILLGLGAVYIISGVLLYVQGIMIRSVGQKFSYNLRKRISVKINLLPLSYFDEVSYGDVLSRVTNDIDTINRALDISLSNVIRQITVIIGVFIMMLTISVRMTLIAVTIVPLSSLIAKSIIKKSQGEFVKQQRFLGELNGYIEEIYAGHNVVKVFNGEEVVGGEFRKLNDSLANAANRAFFLSGLMQPLINVLSNLGYVVVVIFGASYASMGIIQVGDILAFIQYVRNFTMPIANLAENSNIIQTTMAAAERVYEFLEEEELSDEDYYLDPDKIRGEVDFEGVYFGYTEDEMTIKDFTESVKPGEKVAIVGPTGSGKTTLVKLLMRFYEVNKGKIYLDGTDISQVNMANLREQFAMVLQDTWLYSGTIMENIRYGNLDATDEEVIQASKAAYAHRFIQTFPDGYNTVINEEADNISQGQKQLLTIARAIIKDPKIMILDEATSSVDTRTEVFIQRAMDNLMEGRTSFVIAHRLSTIQNADTILVLEDGHIVEKGNHQELIDYGGVYKELYDSQFAISEV